MIEPVEWNPEFEWVEITNSYGKLLNYCLKKLTKGMEDLTYQPIISDLLRTNNYRNFIDVGAHVGYFTMIASKHCNNVYAYEASSFFYSLLLSNTIKLNNVECVNVFIGYKGSKPLLPDLPFRLVAKDRGLLNRNARVFTLDRIFGLGKSDYNHLIKIDVEGNEIDVLKGSTRLLKLPQIHWVIDVHESEALGITMEEVVAFFPDRELVIGNKFLEVYGDK